MRITTPEPTGWSTQGPADGEHAERTHPYGSLRDRDGNPPPFASATAKDAARLRAAEAMRELNTLLLTADGDEDAFAALATALESQTAALRPLPERAPQGWENLATLGVLNVKAPVLRADPDPDDPLLYRIRGTFGIADEGPPGCVHGGVLALILDQCFGAACGLHGSMAMTGTLNIRYERPSPLYTELTFFARVEQGEGRKFTVTGGVLNGDDLCARAEAVMIRPRPTA